VLESVCSSNAEQTYYAHGSRFLTLVNYGNQLLGINAHYNSLEVFDLSNPAAPQLLTASAVANPWTVTGEGTHGSLIPHVQHVAVLDGFRYAVVSLFTAGWDIFDLQARAYLQHGYNPGEALTLFAYTEAHMFSVGGNVYLVGQRLNSSQLNDASVKIYTLSGPDVDPATVTAGTITGIRVPIGQSSDAPPFTDFPLGTDGALHYFTFSVSGKLWLIIKSNNDAALVEITNPTLPVPRARWRRTNFPFLFKGNWAVEANDALLVVADETTEKL